MASIRQKQKLLVLKDYFETCTDEDHHASVNSIIEYLARQGIKAERKTVYDDVEILIESGMDIEKKKEGHSNEYFLAERTFNDVDLLVLADAVASGKFLSDSKSKQLLKKLQKLTSKYKAPGLNRRVYVAKRPKTFNDKIYYAINEINSAITNKMQISFEYYEYTPEKKAVAKHGGELYYVSPHSLVWEDSNYYLTCYCHKHEKICHYRVDRMKKVVVTENPAIDFTPQQLEEAENLTKIYRMFSGEAKTVTMEFDNSLANSVIDKFGQDVLMRKISEEKFAVTAEIQISPPFYGWLLQFGEKARLVSPDDAVEDIKKYIEKLLAIYR